MGGMSANVWGEGSEKDCASKYHQVKVNDQSGQWCLFNIWVPWKRSAEIDKLTKVKG